MPVYIKHVNQYLVHSQGYPHLSSVPLLTNILAQILGCDVRSGRRSLMTRVTQTGLKENAA